MFLFLMTYFYFLVLKLSNLYYTYFYFTHAWLWSILDWKLKNISNIFPSEEFCWIQKCVRIVRGNRENEFYFTYVPKHNLTVQCKGHKSFSFLNFVYFFLYVCHYFPSTKVGEIMQQMLVPCHWTQFLYTMIWVSSIVSGWHSSCFSIFLLNSI